MQVLEETKKSKVPVKYNKVTSRKFFSPHKESEAESVLAMKAEGEQLGRLRHQVNSISDNFSSFVAETSSQVSALMEKNNCEIFMKLHKLETELMKKQQEMVRGLSLEVMALGSRLAAQLESQLEGMQQRLISAEGQLKHTESKLVKMVERVESTVQESGRNIGAVREAVEAVMRKKETPIETTHSIELQEATDPLT